MNINANINEIKTTLDNLHKEKNYDLKLYNNKESYKKINITYYTKNINKNI
jgi:hypothetical protein